MASPGHPPSEATPPTGLASPADSTLAELDMVRREAEFLGVSVEEIVRQHLARADDESAVLDGSPAATVSNPTTDDENEDDGSGVLQIIRSPAPATRRDVRATHSLPPPADLRRHLQQQQQQQRLVRQYANPPSDDGFDSVHSSELGSFDSTGDAEQRGWAVDVDSHYSNADGQGDDDNDGDTAEGEDELNQDDGDTEEMAIDPDLVPVGIESAAAAALVGGSSSSSSAAASLARQKEEQERERRLAAERRKVNSRRPIATKKGKFWKPAELPAEILSCVRCVSSGLSRNSLTKLTLGLLSTSAPSSRRRTRSSSVSTTRACPHPFEHEQRLGDGKQPSYLRSAEPDPQLSSGGLSARPGASQVRLNSLIRKRPVPDAEIPRCVTLAPVDDLSIWRDLLELMGGPKNTALRGRVRFTSSAMQPVWMTCWACVANDDKPLRAEVRTSSIHGAIFACRSHAKPGGCCGRCLGDDEQATEYLVDALVVEPDLYSVQADGTSTSCQACRLEILNKCLYIRDQPIVDPAAARPDGGIGPASRYVNEGVMKVVEAVAKIVESRWVAQWTPFNVFVEGACEQRLDERPAKVKRDRADRRAIALALRGDADMDELGNGDDGEDPFATLHAFEDLTDEDEVDEDDDLDSNGRPRLDEEELQQLARMALTTWTRERILAGYWVSPNEHAFYWNGGLTHLAKLGRQYTKQQMDAQCYRPLIAHQPLIGGDSSAIFSQARLPPPRIYRTYPPSLPLAADLSLALSDEYLAQLTLTLKPALDTLVTALGRMRDPITAAGSLPCMLVLEFVQLGFAWEMGAAELVGAALADGERKGIPATVTLSQVIECARPPTPTDSVQLADQEPPDHPVTTLTTSATESPMIGPVRPSAAPRSARTSIGSATNTGADRSASPESHAHSHSTGPSPALSTPPTSTSPPPHDTLLAKSSEDVPEPILSLQKRYQSSDPRPKTAAVPAIPVDLTQLGRETLEYLALIWWRAWQPLTLCACPICSRRSGRDDVSLHAAAAAAAAGQADEQVEKPLTAADMEEDEIREIMANQALRGLHGGAKRKDEGAATATEDDNERREAGQGETSPVRAKRARVDTNPVLPIDS